MAMQFHSINHDDCYLIRKTVVSSFPCYYNETGNDSDHLRSTFKEKIPTSTTTLTWKTKFLIIMPTIHITSFTLSVHGIMSCHSKASGLKLSFKLQQSHVFWVCTFLLENNQVSLALELLLKPKYYLEKIYKLAKN